MPPTPKILIAEQDPELLAMIWTVLIQMGAEPREFESGQEAVELIDREKFDGFIVDFEMPDVSGLEIAEKIRWSKSNSRCPIVMITGSREPGILKECFRAGANFFLEKPVTPEQIQTLFNATRGIMLGEQRRYQRVRVRVPVHCEWALQSLPQQARGKSINLSSSGMLVRLELTPPSQGVVQLQFKLPGDLQPFDLTSRVSSIRGSGEIGLTFVGLGEEDRKRLIAFTELILQSGLDAASAARSA